MGVGVASLIVMMFTLYLAVGVFFGVVFLFFGLGRRVDPSLKIAPYRARFLFLPGAVALWPYLFWRSLTGRKGPDLDWSPLRNEETSK